MNNIDFLILYEEDIFLLALFLIELAITSTSEKQRVGFEVGSFNTTVTAQSEAQTYCTNETETSLRLL